MTSDNDSLWPPTTFARGFQEAGEQVMEQQAEFFSRMFAPGVNAGLGGFDAMSRRMGVFKTRVQSGGRISIPDAERDALNIREGEIVQTIVIPMGRGTGEDRADE